MKRHPLITTMLIASAGAALTLFVTYLMSVGASRAQVSELNEQDLISRVARLEAKVDAVDKKTDDLKVDLRYLISHVVDGDGVAHK